MVLRHDRSVFWEEDGAVEFKILAPMLVSQFESSPRWSIRAWLNHLQRGGGPKKRFQYLLGSSLCRDFSKLSRNSRAFWRRPNQSSIARQRVVTERLRRVHLPRWKLPRHALNHQIRIGCGWKRYRELETDGNSSLQWILCIHIYTSSGITTWRRPELQCTNKIWKIHQNTVSWATSRVVQKKGLSSIKRDPSRSAFTTLYRRCVLRRWWSWIQEKNCTAESVNLLVHRKESYRNHPCTIDDRTLQTLTREHPPPILNSAGRPAALKSTIRSKGYHTLPLNKKTIHAKK